MLRSMWCILGLLALVANIKNIDGAECPEETVRKVQQVHWAKCDEENQRMMKELNQKTAAKEQLIHEACCVLSDTMTCWVNSLRSECGDEAANKFIETAEFKDDCVSWKYPDSIALCQAWYTRWWFITIMVILGIIIVASLVVWGLRKRARRGR